MPRGISIIAKSVCVSTSSLSPKEVYKNAEDLIIQRFALKISVTKLNTTHVLRCYCTANQVIYLRG